MARKRKLLIPEAREALERLKGEVVRDQQGSSNSRQNGSLPPPVLTSNNRPQSSEAPVDAMAAILGIPYNANGDNGNLSTRDAGKIGGNIGGPMVKKLITLAQEQLQNQNSPRVQ